MEALSPATIIQRQRERKRPGQILIRSGKAGGLLGRINYSPRNDRVTVSANKVYATTHHFGAKKGQFGTVLAQIPAHIRTLASGKKVSVKAHSREMKVPWGDIPARPFMMVQGEDWDEIRETLLDFLAFSRG